jgi:hypothetical protein
MQLRRVARQFRDHWVNPVLLSWLAVPALLSGGVLVLLPVWPAGLWSLGWAGVGWRGDAVVGPQSVTAGRAEMGG